MILGVRRDRRGGRGATGRRSTSSSSASRGTPAAACIRASTTSRRCSGSPTSSSCCCRSRPRPPACSMPICSRACARGALLVNAARGPIVDTAALLELLQAGRIRAALDVTDPEPLGADHPLWDAPGDFCSPPISRATRRAAQRRAFALVGEQVAPLPPRRAARERRRGRVLVPVRNPSARVPAPLRGDLGVFGPSLRAPRRSAGARRARGRSGRPRRSGPPARARPAPRARRPARR